MSISNLVPPRAAFLADIYRIVGCMAMDDAPLKTLTDIVALLSRAMPGMVVMLTVGAELGVPAVVGEAGCGAPAPFSSEIRTPALQALAQNRPVVWRAGDASADVAFQSWAAIRRLSWGTARAIRIPQVPDPVGAWAFYFRTPTPWGDQLQETVLALEPLVVLTLAHHWLKRRGQIAERRSAVFQALADQRPLDEVLALVAAAVESQVPEAKAAVLTWRLGFSSPRLVAGPRLINETQRAIEDAYRQAEGSIREVEEQGAHLSDLIGPKSPVTGVRRVLEHFGIRASYFVPVPGQETTQSGVVCYFDRPNVPTTAERELIFDLVGLVQVVETVACGYSGPSRLGLTNARGATVNPRAIVRGRVNSRQIALRGLRLHTGRPMRVVQDMAEVARLLGWRQRPGEPLVELAGLIRETVALVHMDDRRGAPVTIVTLEECLIAGDVQRLRTALRRLWRDASASASPGTVIRVGLSGANGTVHLFLQQSLAGAGGETDPKALPVLLGLDAAETIVAQFPGGVNLAVDWHDFRSVLTLSVPAKRPPLVDPPRRTVLVVDDNRSFLDVFLDLLQRDGFDPRGVTSLEEARQAAVSIQPPLAVLCDLTLSDGAGWELLPYLRTLPGWERVPVAALTGWDDYDGTDLTQQGFDAVMLKPVKRHTWLEWLRQIESR